MKHIFFLLLTAFASAVALAQEATTTNVDINLKGGGSSFPWIWVVGGLVFVLLLVALLSGGRRTDRVVHKETVIKE